METDMHRLLLLAAALAAATPGAATPAERLVRVAHADLDLATDAGVAALDRRIRAAANRLCEAGAARSVIEQRAGMRCRMDAIATAAGQRSRAIAAARGEPLKLAGR
jgi:UrcA family protein